MNNDQAHLVITESGVTLFITEEFLNLVTEHLEDNTFDKMVRGVEYIFSDTFNTEEVEAVLAATPEGRDLFLNAIHNA